MVGIALEQHGPWAIVAGASEGIGEAFARQLHDAGFGVVLVSRRKDTLDALAASIVASAMSSGSSGSAAASGPGTTPNAAAERCRVVALDLTAHDAVEQLVAATADLDVGLVVYNAGADTMAVRFHDRTIDEVMHLLSLNVVTPTRLCHHFGRLMRGRGRGGIILVGSMAGLAGTGWVATYAATKAFDQILAEGLWRELRRDGVDAMALVAGATATPAHDRMGARITAEYPPMDPAAVAREGLAAIGSGPVWVAGAANRAVFDALHTVSRVDLIEQMTAGTQLLFDLSD